VLDAKGFDAWHADVAKSSACDLIFREALGLPREVNSNSLLPGAGIAEVAGALRLSPGQLLADLACGRGGYGLAVARLTGAHLTGLDFSAVAVSAAAQTVPRFGLAGRVRFCLGELTAIGLRDHSVDAVMCIDAIQFADPPLAGLRECRRILAEGGRLAVTGWEAVDPADERLPPRIRRMNLARDLAEAGFAEIEVTEQPAWHDAERALWEAAMAVDPAGDPGLVALREEAARVLETFSANRRVLATATASQASTLTPTTSQPPAPTASQPPAPAPTASQPPAPAPTASQPPAPTTSQPPAPTTSQPPYGPGRN
jgi:SAM-dependent methyltransferase